MNKKAHFIITISHSIYRHIHSSQTSNKFSFSFLPKTKKFVLGGKKRKYKQKQNQNNIEGGQHHRTTVSDLTLRLITEPSAIKTV